MESYLSSNAAVNKNNNNNDLDYLKLVNNNNSESGVSVKISSSSSSSFAGRKSNNVVTEAEANAEIEVELMKLSSDEDGSKEESPMVVEEEEEDFLEMEVETSDSDDYDSEADDEESSGDEEEEETEEEMEEKRILSDALQLKQLAGFFAHPEKPTTMDGLSRGRNVFSQPWAAETSAEDDEEERNLILAEARALKKTAAFFLHPEAPLEVDATAFGRNYFGQPWATPQETFGAAEARALAIKETKALKELAVQYQHPEAPLNVDPTTFGRNYFLRASAEDQTTVEQDDETARILVDARALKQTAAFYLHPEAPVETDSATFGRNYFGRASAEDYEDDEHADEREIILEEMKELKQAAVDFAHPEIALRMDPFGTAGGRNYYNRASAEATEAMATVDERQLIFQEMKQLKQAALDYRHPEMPLQVDATACGRNYYGRASADDVEVDAPEQDRILAECALLKKTAVDFMHPELPVVVDSTAFGRNFYGRESANDHDDEEGEREQILEEMAALSKSASIYRHPEMPLQVDSTCFGRNYFARASAVEQESFAASEERARMVAEAAKLKAMATMYLHPELPVDTDGAACGRNYYSRPAAEEYESREESEERARVLADVAQLTRLAVDFQHPEKPLEVDPSCFGRSYFGRASVEGQEDDEYSDDREIILAEMAELKQAASDFLHPEKPVSMDATMCCRNFFGRASAPDQESFEEAEERVRVLAEASSLKKLAVDFNHPELPLATTDATACARSYFSRPSAPGDSFEEAEARERVLEDAACLKKLAVDFLHPEREVQVSATACARNFFSRPSAPEQLSAEEEQERTAILAEASALKKLAFDYLHPEVGIKTTDPNACGRNYFARPSALGVSEHITTSGHANYDEVYAEEHSQHDDYGHFDMDEDIFYDMRQTIVLPGETNIPSAPKIQSSKLSSDEEGELSRSPSSIMLFTGAYEDADHPALPSMG